MADASYEPVIETHAVQFPKGLENAPFAGAGISGMAVHLDAAVKFAWLDTQKSLDREQLVYERFKNECDGILHYYGLWDRGIVLEYAAHKSIRHYLRYNTTDSLPSLSLRLTWALQISEAVAFAHSKHVLHGDISCNNVFLVKGYKAKLGDFAGSSIDGLEPLTSYETSHEVPNYDGQISITSEIFALGSTFYEIMTGSKPYAELEHCQIESRYEQGQFPDVTSIDALVNVILKCWNKQYIDTNDLLSEVKAEGTISRFFQSIGSLFNLRHSCSHICR